MAEEKYKVNTYEIDFKCDICGKGWYRPTGEVYPTYPFQFPHKCNYCGAEMIVSEHTYPYTVTEKITKRKQLVDAQDVYHLWVFDKKVDMPFGIGRGEYQKAVNRGYSITDLDYQALVEDYRRTGKL